MQELLQAHGDLRRAETDPSAMWRDHATVNGELVRQPCRTRSLEEEGSRLRRRLANAQRAARDVAVVVEERLNRHLPAILEAAQIVRDERFSQPTVEQALRGWVPAGYGPPSTANPNFREICATLVCAAVLRVDPPPSLEALSRRLRVMAQPAPRFPTKAVGQGPQLGVSAGKQPSGPAQAPREAQVATPSAPATGHLRVDGTPGSSPGGDGTPSAADQAMAVATTPGQDGLRSLLVHLNKVPQELQTGEAQKRHLHLATTSDLPPEFPQSNLRSQYTAKGKLLPTRPELDRLVGQFVQEHQLAPIAPQDPAPESEGAAGVTAAARANQAGGSRKPAGKGKGGADYDTYSVAVMVKWRVNLRYPPEAIYPMSPGRLGMVLKKAFGDFRVSYIKDEGQLCHTEDGGWAIMSMRPEAAHVLERNGGDSDKQFSYERSKAKRQPYTGGLLRVHHPEKSNAIAQRLRSGDLWAGPNGVVQARDRDGAGDEGRKRCHSPSMSPPRTSRRLEEDYTPCQGSRYSSPEEEPYQGGPRPTPQPSGGQRDGRYDNRRHAYYRSPVRGEPSRHSLQWLPREDVRGPEHRQYEPHGGYGERMAYPRPESYPMTQAHQAPVAAPRQPLTGARHQWTHATRGMGEHPSTGRPCPRRGRTSSRRRISTTRTCRSLRSRT